MTQSRRTLLVTAIGFALLAAAFMLNRYYVGEQVEASAKRLQLLSQLRRDALEQYFDTAQTELRFWSINPDIVQWQQQLNFGANLHRKLFGDPNAMLRRLYLEGNPFPAGQRNQHTNAYDGSGYSAFHADLHPTARLFVTERGYYDFFLIGPGGDVYYTVEKEDDYGTNLLTGRWQKSGLGSVFQRALEYADTDQIAISDMQAYEPSDGAPAIFMAKAMHNRLGELIGVIAVQLPTARILDIMNFSAGMGETGETYLVGEDGLMRSNSRFSRETTVLKTRVKTEAVSRAQNGEEDVAFIADYRNVEVLSAWTSFEFDLSKWSVIAEIDREEIMARAAGNLPLISGLMILLYGLSLWSLWFIRQESAQADSGGGLADISFADNDWSE